MKVAKKLVGFSVIALAVQGCGLSLSNNRLTTIDWDEQQQAGTIAISDPKMFRREALINERREEVAWINDLIKKSPEAEFTPEVLREVEVIRAFSLALGLNFDPAAGANFSNSQATNELQQEIAVMRLQLQLDQLKRDAELARAAFDEQTELVNSNLTALDANSGVSALPNAVTASAATNTLLDTIKNLQSRLDVEAKGPLKADSVSTNPIDQFRDRLAYRNILEDARNAATLDELHDLGNKALMRLSFQATTIPPSKNSAAPAVIQMKVKPASESSKETYYLGWLAYLNTLAVKHDLARKPGEPFYLEELAVGDLFSTLTYEEDCQRKNPCRSVQYALPRIAGVGRGASASRDFILWMARVVRRERTVELNGRWTCLEGSEKVRKPNGTVACGRRVIVGPLALEVESQEGRSQEVATDGKAPSGPTPEPTTTEAWVYDEDVVCALNDTDGNRVGPVHQCRLDLPLDRLASDNLHLFVNGLRQEAYTPTTNYGVLLRGSEVFYSSGGEIVDLYNYVEGMRLRAGAGELLAQIEFLNSKESFDAKCKFDNKQQRPARAGYSKPWPTCDDIRNKFKESSETASLFLRELTFELGESAASDNLVQANLRALSGYPSSIAALPAQFSALLDRDSEGARIYEVGPRQQVQQVGTNARSASSLGIALAVAASKPTSGIGANANSNFSQQATSKVQARERVPAVTGYAVGSQQTFGWVLGPQASVDRKGKLDLTQALRPYDLSVDLSVPKWWKAVVIEATNTWSPTQGDIARGYIRADKNKTNKSVPPQTFEVYIPRSEGDMRALTRQLAAGDFGYTVRTMRLTDGQDLKQTVSACRATTVFLEGDQVWRSNAVLIDGYRIGEESISVAPDMTGALIQFPALDKKISPNASGFVVATLMSPYGPAEVKLNFESAPKPGGCTKEPDTSAISAKDVSPKKLSIRNPGPPGTQLETFTLTGANLDKVGSIKLGNQQATDVAGSVTAKKRQFTLTWDQIRSLNEGQNRLQLLDAKGEEKAAKEIVIESVGQRSN